MKKTTVKEGKEVKSYGMTISEKVNFYSLKISVLERKRDNAEKKILKFSKTLQDLKKQK